MTLPPLSNVTPIVRMFAHAAAGYLVGDGWLGEEWIENLPILVVNVLALVWWRYDRTTAK